MVLKRPAKVSRNAAAGCLRRVMFPASLARKRFRIRKLIIQEFLRSMSFYKFLLFSNFPRHSRILPKINKQVIGEMYLSNIGNEIGNVFHSFVRAC